MDRSEWLTKGILISCVQKNNLFKKLKKTPMQENEITYKKFKNKLTHIIRIAKKNLTCIEIMGKNMGNNRPNTEKEKQKNYSYRYIYYI